MNLERATAILSETKPARSVRDRYRQRDELQHAIVPHLPANERDAFERDAFERALNRHFRL